MLTCLANVPLQFTKLFKVYYTIINGTLHMLSSVTARQTSILLYRVMSIDEILVVLVA